MSLRTFAPIPGPFFLPGIEEIRAFLLAARTNQVLAHKYVVSPIDINLGAPYYWPEHTLKWHP